MKNKVFIAYSFANKNEFENLNSQLKKFLQENYNAEVSSFVFDSEENMDHETMMKLALEMIDKSQIIIAELTYKPIGVGLEVGYAKAKNKKIIYIHKLGSELSTTVNGIADYRIEYNNIDDLLLKLKESLYNY